MEQSIYSLMSADHVKIRKLVDKVDDYKAFMKLKAELERHFYLEENAIFKMLEAFGYDENAGFLPIMEEHDEILSMLGRIQYGFSKSGKSSLDKLRSKLLNHAEHEDKILYPNLDQNLSPTEREAVMRQIRMKQEYELANDQI